MPYTYRVMHLDQTAYNLKYKYGQSFTPTQITYHQTNNNASALHERNYLNNRTDNKYIGFHLIVDDQEVIECLPLTIQTWHAGDAFGDGNMKSIGVEMAYSTSQDINLRDKAIANGATLIANLMKTYNISIDNVYSHRDRTGKICPRDLISRYGEARFRNLIQSEYERLTQSNRSTPASEEFTIGETVTVYQETPGYISSGSLMASTTIKPGEYIVCEVASGTRHPLNISISGKAPGIWITLTSPDFVIGDSVYVSTTIKGYDSSMSETATTTVDPGDYVVNQVDYDGEHPINLLIDGSEAGFWVDSDELTLNDERLLSNEGE